jgi:hypothetical protein
MIQQVVASAQIQHGRSHTSGSVHDVVGSTITGRRRSPRLAYFITASTQWGATANLFPQVAGHVPGRRGSSAWLAGRACCSSVAYLPSSSSRTLRSAK